MNKNETSPRDRYRTTPLKRPPRINVEIIDEDIDDTNEHLNLSHKSFSSISQMSEDDVISPLANKKYLYREHWNTMKKKPSTA